ncbi:PAS domain-containing sensor histidine kinase [Alishewanella sp. d11]|uniref:PAS domain-containing sensor histidine kinase n=1 Tax=Alishewanella sp. d11 TaxID=3414030 RepID=UPI003BF87CBE
MDIELSHYQSLVNNIPGISYRCLFDEQWTMLFISTHVDYITGYTAAELLHNNDISYADLIIAEDNCRVGKAVAAAIANHLPWTVEYRVRHKQGHIRWASERGQAVYDEQGQVKFLDGFILDITAEKLAKQEMARLAVLVRNSSEAMFLLQDGKFIDCNAAALALFGYSKDDLLKNHPATLSPVTQANGKDSITLGAHYIALAAKGEPQKFEWVHQTRSGLLFDAEVTLNRFIEEDDIIVFGIVRDISEQKQRQRQIQELNVKLEQRVAERTAELQQALEHLKQTQHELLQSEKLASLGALVAGIAHELNTPLGNAVTVTSSLFDAKQQFSSQLAAGLTRKALDTFLAEIAEGYEIIERNLSRAAELIGRFKQLAVDQTSYQRRSFVLDEIVQEVLMAMRPVLKRSAVTITQEIDPTLIMDSYPGPLGQILMNLINNAMIHAFEPEQAGIIALKASRTAAHLQLVVQDNGCGIAPAALTRIFDPFYTTKLGKGGSGLGLHIVHTLITGILEGSIDVVSLPGTGTSFTITLPLNVTEKMPI